MAPKIFITGATGLIGGDVLYVLQQSNPEYEYTCVVRNSDSGAKVAAVYPKVRLVYGTLDDSALLEEEAAKADVVIHTADASDHEGAARAIAKGIFDGHTKSRPGFWIHTSGTGILTWRDQKSQTYGESPTYKPYDDLEDVSALTNLPNDAFHRDIDKIVLEAAARDPEAVRVAIICPPTIYGAGRGPGNQRSRQVNVLVNSTLKRGKAPMLGKGLTEWDHIHVHDLAAMYMLLTKEAVANKMEHQSELWGPRGYFLAESGHHVWGEVSKWIGEAAYKAGYIKSNGIDSMSVEEAKELAGFEALSWGLNSRGIAKRAKRYLGWEPVSRSLKDELPSIIEGEAKELGLKKGHAEEIADAK